MDTSTEEYFQQVLETVKEFEPYSEEELEKIEQDHSVTFPSQLRQLFLRANDMVGWETSKFSLLTMNDLDEVFAGEDVDAGEDFKEEGYDNDGLFPFGSIENKHYGRFIFIDTEGTVSDTEGAIIWQDRTDHLDPSYMVLENNLAEFLDGIVKGINYHERIVDFIDEASEGIDDE